VPKHAENQCIAVGLCPNSDINKLGSDRHLLHIAGAQLVRFCSDILWTCNYSRFLL